MLKKMSIKNKVILLLIIPIVSLLLLALKIINSDHKKLHEFESLEVSVQLTTNISRLVHETQKERGATAGYLGSKGLKFKDILIAQRKLTNKRISEFNQFLDKNDFSEFSKSLNEAITKASTDLSKIESIRKSVDSLTLPAKKAISYYTNMNAKFLNNVIEVSKIATDPEIAKQLVAYSNFLLSKERAGIERAIGSNTLALDKFGPGMRIKFNNLIASQNSFMENFLKYASDDSKNYYNKTLVGKDVEEVNAIRSTLLNSASKHELVSSMKELVGYGGFIHNFKNYVIRGLSKYDPKVRAQYKELLQKIEKYKALGNISNEEIELLSNVEKVFTKYYNGLNSVTSAVKNGMEVKLLDKVVKVSDGPAIKSLNKLDQSLFSVDSEYWFATITNKINLLKKIDDYLANELLITISSKYDEASAAFYMVISILIISLLVTLSLSFIIVKGIIESLQEFKSGLISFFSYVNKETSKAQLLDDSNRGEIGLMAKAVNENINKVRIEIEEEKKIIDKTINVLKEFEQGDLSQRINLTSSNEALNELTKLLDNMAQNFEQNIDNVLKVLTEYSSYNYMNKIDNNNLKAHLKSLSDGVNQLGDSITEMLIDSKQVGTELNSSSETLLKNVDVVNQSSTSAAASLEETAASLEEITGTIVSNSESIAKMSNFASKLNSSTSQGERLASQTVVAMDEINTQVSSINEAIEVIDQIAFQTNILSLNAAVEAATAGEAGKGFAVVAQEVRNLASRSAEAAKEIKDLVEKANEKAVEGKDIAGSMIKGYESLNENIVSTIDLIRDVESSSKEQRAGIEQINDAISMQDQQTQEIARAASQTYDVAMNTSNLSHKIVDNANEKEFEGKDSI